MLLHSAQNLCPKLMVLPYDFDAYARISNEMFKVLMEFVHPEYVMAVSVDEAIVDITAFLNSDTATSSHDERESRTLSVCRKIRKTIFERTECSASIGASHNILLARYAPRPYSSLILFKATN